MSAAVQIQSTNIDYRSRNYKLEASILALMPTDYFKTKFSERLSADSQSYWQIISEMRAIYIFHRLLDIPVVDIAVKTNGEKDVDFVCEWYDKKVFVEVKGFRPEDYQIARKGGVLGNDEEKIDRALGRSQKKFLDNTCNIVVIADEDTIKPPLFMNQLIDIERTPEIYLNNIDYAKTSAILVLGGMYYEQMFHYKVWYNSNPQRELPADLVAKLDQNKANKIP